MAYGDISKTDFSSESVFYSWAGGNGAFLWWSCVPASWWEKELVSLKGVPALPALVQAGLPSPLSAHPSPGPVAQGLQDRGPGETEMQA